MSRQRWILFGIILLVSIVCIAIVNQVFIRPVLVGTLPEIKTVATPPAPAPLGKADLFVATMEQIRSKNQNQSNQAIMAAVRNPFLPIDQKLEAPKAVVLEAPKAVVKIQFTLFMVIAGDRQSLALINNQFVSEGSRISGYEVKTIRPRSVILANKTDTKKLTLKPGGILYRKG